MAGVAQTHIRAWHFAWQAWHKLTSTVVLHGRRGTNSHPPSFCVAGVALIALGGALGPDLSPVTPRLFAWQPWYLVTSTFVSRWQAWHKLTSTFVLRGRRGTYGIGWRAWSGFVARDAAAVCVAAVVLGDIHLRFTWQAWHKLTSTVILRGRRGTHSHPPSFCVAGVALMLLGGALGPDLSPVTPLPFAWQAWHLVAGVALGDIHLHFTWQVWHKLTSTVILRGRRGTHSHPPSFCVAGVALMVLGSG